mmetsp:Transcript_53099/g.156942  ORF Transcript_53099/g.156942 Transcript_53099/m.156942 type:complete len:297 (+) Transcript_53099:577-1467(+)
MLREAREDLPRLLLAHLDRLDVQLVRVGVRLGVHNEAHANVRPRDVDRPIWVVGGRGGSGCRFHLLFHFLLLLRLEWLAIRTHRLATLARRRPLRTAFLLGRRLLLLAAALARHAARCRRRRRRTDATRDHLGFEHVDRSERRGKWRVAAAHLGEQRRRLVGSKHRATRRLRLDELVVGETRDDVEVRMEDELPRLLAAVGEDVDAWRAGGVLHGLRQPRQLGEHGGGDIGRHVRHGDARMLRQQQRVARRHGEGVEDGDRVRRLEDLEGGNVALDDFCEDVLGIVGRHLCSSLRV